jgi:hypothetical protein
MTSRARSLCRCTNRDSTSTRAANYAYLSILMSTGGMLALAYELLRLVGVRWLVTMSPEVVARVIRRRRRILRTTHRLLSDKMSSNASVETISGPLTELSLPVQRFQESNSSYSRTLLAEEALGDGDTQEVRGDRVSPCLSGSMSACLSVSLSVSLSLCLSVCFSVSLFLCLCAFVPMEWAYRF